MREITTLREVPNVVKLFRTVRSENMKLWGRGSTAAGIAAVFVLCLLVTVLVSLGVQRKSDLLPGWMEDSIEEQQVSVTDTMVVTVETQAQVVTASGSDASGTDIITVPAATEEKTVSLTWQEAYMQRIDRLKEESSRLSADAQIYGDAEAVSAQIKQQECMREALILNRCLEKDAPASYSKEWNTVLAVFRMMLALLAVCVSVVTAEVFASEFKSGTINSLVTLPQTRTKIYLGKRLTVCLYALALTAAAYAGCCIGASAVFGGLPKGGNYLQVLGTGVASRSFFAHSAEVAVCAFFTLVLVIACSVCFACITRSYGCAVAVPVLLMLVSLVFGRTLGHMGQTWLGLTLPVNLELSVPISKTPNYTGASFAASYLSAFAHWLIFTVAGYLGMKRDIN